MKSVHWYNLYDQAFSNKRWLSIAILVYHVYQKLILEISVNWTPSNGASWQLLGACRLFPHRHPCSRVIVELRWPLRKRPVVGRTDETTHLISQFPQDIDLAQATRQPKLRGYGFKVGHFDTVRLPLKLDIISCSANPLPLHHVSSALNSNLIIQIPGT